MDYILSIIAAILIFVIGIIAGRLVSNLLKKFLISLKWTLFEKNKLKEYAFELTISNLVKWAIYMVTIILTLQQLRVPNTALWIIAVIFIAIVIIFIILTFKDWIPNMRAGIKLKKNEAIKVGKYLTVNNIKGKVVSFNILETKIINNKGEEIHIPNSLIKNDKS